MKKFCCFVLMLFLLAAPSGAVRQSTLTPLCFGADQTVYGISAEYAVLTENVAELAVTFAPSVENYADANYVDGVLYVGVASAEPIDLTQVLGQVSATLTDESSTAPQLQLTRLRFNGKKASCNLYLEEVLARREGAGIRVSISAVNDYPTPVRVMVAAYRQNGQLISSGFQTDAGLEQSFSVEVMLTDCPDAAYVKVFSLTSELVPLAEGRKISVS